MERESETWENTTEYALTFRLNNQQQKHSQVIRFFYLNTHTESLDGWGTDWRKPKQSFLLFFFLLPLLLRSLIFDLVARAQIKRGMTLLNRIDAVSFTRASCLVGQDAPLPAARIDPDPCIGQVATALFWYVLSIYVYIFCIKHWQTSTGEVTKYGTQSCMWSR